MFNSTTPKIFAAIIVIVLISAWVCCGTGCNALGGKDDDTSVYSIPDSISFDEYGNRTAGLVGVDKDGNFIITQSAVDKYNALIGRYGQDELPPIHKNDGITKYKRDGYTTGCYIIESKYLYAFARMNVKEQQRLRAIGEVFKQISIERNSMINKDNDEKAEAEEEEQQQQKDGDDEQQK